MKARKLPSGNWICESSFIDKNGRRVRKSFTADTKKGAESLALSFKLQAVSPVRERVCDVLDSYILSKEPVLSASTIRSYRSIRRFIENEYPELSVTAVSDLDDKTLQKFINSFSKNHSPKTVRNYYALLLASLPRSVRIMPSVTLPQRVRPKYHIPDTNGVQAILSASRGTELEIPILLASVCTMRSGEICALTLDDIENNRIHVSKSLTRGAKYNWYVKAPKTYSSDRFIDAPEWLIKKVKEKGIPKFNPDSLSKAFRRLLETNNLPRVRFHDLRHFSASYMHAQGIPTVYIMKRGGWNSETVLNEVYRHVLDDIEKKQTEKINAEFSSLFS